MAVADADQRFLYVNVGSYGRSSDGGIWRDCGFNRALHNGEIPLPTPKALPPLHDGHPIPYHLVADEAFSLSPYLMKPYARRGLAHEQVIFNYRLSRARRIVENCFGRLAAVWRIFQKSINIQPDRADNIVMACCVLHNYLLANNALPHSIDTDAYITDGSWRNAIDNSNLVELPPRRHGNNASREAKDIQESLKEWFNGIGAVHWQQRQAQHQ